MEIKLQLTDILVFLRLVGGVGSRHGVQRSLATIRKYCTKGTFITQITFNEIIFINNNQRFQYSISKANSRLQKHLIVEQYNPK